MFNEALGYVQRNPEPPAIARHPILVVRIFMKISFSEWRSFEDVLSPEQHAVWDGDGLFPVSFHGPQSVRSDGKRYE